MPTPLVQSQVPWSALDGGTATDAVTGNVCMEVSLRITGTVANVQADWATLAAVSLVSPSCVMSNDIT